MKKRVGVLIGFMLACVAFSIPQGKRDGRATLEKWVATYDGPAHSSDGASAIAVDSSGNIYVTGSSRGIGTDVDYATIKYDTSGKQLWAARYNGPENLVDEASAIAVDRSGNVYVTGRSRGSSNEYDDCDYATIKYDTNGKQLWAKRYSGLHKGANNAWAIAVDSSGNVYVTGLSYGSGDNYDYVTIKYNTRGKQLWVGRYNGPGDSDDFASAIAVDRSGNVYVTGKSKGSSTCEDYATIKYNTNGKPLWVTRYNGPANYVDEARALALDGSGNVYIAGRSWGSGTDYDYATIKYNTNGKQLWAKRYDGPGHLYDEANAVAVDGSGNVYVTGYCMLSRNEPTKRDCATIKYDTSGKQLWAKRYDGPGHLYDKANAIAVDSSGNVYVTGSSGDYYKNLDYATIKYNKSGKLVWAEKYSGSGNSTDEAMAIAVDGSGNVYVTGYGAPYYNSSYDYVTLKY